MSKLYATVVIVGLALSFAQAQQQPSPATQPRQLSPYTFRITAANCRSKMHPRRIFAGFRVKDQPGIVTALHGVVGCGEISATNTRGLLLNESLQIVAVDLDHDAALLLSKEVANMPPAGFERGQTFDKNALWVEGMPRATMGVRSDVKTNDPFLTPLDPLIGDKTFGPNDTLHGRASTRNSPSLGANVLSLKGLEPGDSGGPVLDAQNHVVAIADGGLEGGGSKVCWAIPYGDVHWVALAKLDTYSHKRYESLFDFEQEEDFFAYEDSQPTDSGGPLILDTKLEKAQVDKQLKRVLDGTGKSSWERPDKPGDKGRTRHSGFDESRKFEKLEGCSLHLQMTTEFWWNDDGIEGGGYDREYDVVIDLTRTTARMMPCCSSTSDPTYYTPGASVLNISGVPGFQQVQIKSSTTSKSTGKETSSQRSDESWNLFYTTQEAAKEALAAMNRAIALCNQGQ